MHVALHKIQLAQVFDRSIKHQFKAKQNWS